MKTRQTPVMRWLTSAALLGVAALQQPVFAHPGHGHSDVAGTSPLHYLIEPMHLIPIAAGVVAMGAAGMWWRRRRRRSQDRTTS